ncbi:MAG: hypothetical protein JJ975_03475 [Bacteroidia bacterium]|nr:hypothetical protein [Bacteroidia bacterium]
MSEAAKKVLTPTLNNKKVQLKTGELKPTLYYALSKKYATVLRIGGPGEVTIFLRTKMQEDEASDSKYHLRYVLDGKIVKVKPVGSSKASKKTLVVGKSYRVSVVKKVQIIIPPGKHRLEVFSLNDERLVFSKYYFEKHVKPKWKVKQPINNMEATSLTTVESKKVLNYYRIDSENGMKIEMDENTYLRLLVRVEFKHSMFSDNEMRIQMKENGKVVYTFKVSSVRSKYVVYTEGGKLIPGTLNKIYIRVPEGKHKYEFVVADKSKTALIKASYDKLRFPTNSNVPISNP